MTKTFISRPFAASLFALAFLVAPAHAITADQELAAFNAADRNNNDLIERNEWNSFVNELADYGYPLAKRVRRFGVYGIGFRRTDANGDGVLSPNELRRSQAQNENLGADRD